MTGSFPDVQTVRTPHTQRPLLVTAHGQEQARATSYKCSQLGRLINDSFSYLG